MKDNICPHLIECRRFVLKHDFEWKCLGKISWNQENCFKKGLLGEKEMRRTPLEWWALTHNRSKNESEIEIMDEGLALENIPAGRSGPVYVKRLKKRIENCKALENVEKYDFVVFVSKKREIVKHRFQK